MKETVIKVHNLSKVYHIGELGTGTISHDLNRWWKMRILRKEDPFALVNQVNDRTKAAQKGELVRAINDINFEVKQGEVLGIIGKNGAGKSTLLKVLSRITAPTTGYAKIKGRVASLLEVGTGFHPEMTGRENIFLNGAIHGMNRGEIRRKLDEIVDFAGIAKYLDTPVKRFSSGMTVRLGFAVAAFLEPEILIIDEVLAVGDAEFQKKAIGKMQDVSKGEGRTVIFVSHNLGTIRALCKKSILLVNGKLEIYDDTNLVLRKYEMNQLDLNSTKWINTENIKSIARLESIEVTDKNNNSKYEYFNNEDIYIHFRIRSLSMIKNIKIGFDLLKNGSVAFRTQQVDKNFEYSYIPNEGYYYIKCRIPSFQLNVGEYQIKPLFSIHCAESLTKVEESILSFKVIINPKLSTYHNILNEENHPGLVFPFLDWSSFSRID